VNLFLTILHLNSNRNLQQMFHLCVQSSAKLILSLLYAIFGSLAVNLYSLFITFRTSGENNRAFRHAYRQNSQISQRGGSSPRSRRSFANSAALHSLTAIFSPTKFSIRRRSSPSRHAFRRQFRHSYLLLCTLHYELGVLLICTSLSSPCSSFVARNNFAPGRSKSRNNFPSR